MAAIASSAAARSARLGLRATPEQEVVLRRAAEVAHKSLTDFILDSACLAAEQTLLDQRIRKGMGQYPVPVVIQEGLVVLGHDFARRVDLAIADHLDGADGLELCV